MFIEIEGRINFEILMAVSWNNSQQKILKFYYNKIDWGAFSALKWCVIVQVQWTFFLENWGWDLLESDIFIVFESEILANFKILKGWSWNIYMRLIWRKYITGRLLFYYITFSYIIGVKYETDVSFFYY